jgi:hypothetical protein
VAALRGLAGELLEHRLAPLMDAGRTGFRAFGDLNQQIGQLGSGRWLPSTTGSACALKVDLMLSAELAHAVGVE